MSKQKKALFKLQKEEDKSVQKMSNKCNAITLCVIAPFTPLRIAPRRSLRASFSFPDEFVLEEFVYDIIDKYPEKDNRPLYISYSIAREEHCPLLT